MLVVPLATQAQDRDLNKLYNKYKNVAGFEYDHTEPDMDLDTDWDFGAFLDDIENFYVLSFNNKKNDQSNLIAFKSKLEKLTNKKDFKSIVDIARDDVVQILKKKNNSGKTLDYLVIAKDDNEIAFI